MPAWMRDAPPEPRGPALPIRRTPAYKPLTAVVTSGDLIGCYTHFYKGHTVPCEKPECEACQDGIPYRWHSYVAAVDTVDGLHFIFECTAQATEVFAAYRDAAGTLRGCLFKAQRLNQRPNGRVLIQTQPADLTKRNIPTAPDLRNCMAIIWSLPINSVETNRIDPERSVPVADVAAKLVHSLHPNPPDKPKETS